METVGANTGWIFYNFPSCLLHCPIPPNWILGFLLTLPGNYTNVLSGSSRQPPKSTFCASTLCASHCQLSSSFAFSLLPFPCASSLPAKMVQATAHFLIGSFLHAYLPEKQDEVSQVKPSPLIHGFQRCLYGYLCPYEEEPIVQQSIHTELYLSILASEDG